MRRIWRAYKAAMDTGGLCVVLLTNIAIGCGFAAAMGLYMLIAHLVGWGFVAMTLGPAGIGLLLCAGNSIKDHLEPPNRGDSQG